MKELIHSLLGSLVPIFALIMLGLGLRRLGAVAQRGTEALSKAVIYFFFPILVFYRIALTDNPSEIAGQYMIHIWAVIVLFGSGLIALLWFLLTGTKANKRTFIFSVAMPNWIFLPLAIAGPLWGDESVRLIILFNIPTQVILWTAGVWLLRGSIKGAHALRFILLNPGLLGTAAGLLTAFGLLPISLTEGGRGISLNSVSPLLDLIGRLTIPLSIVALGLYLGERMERREGEKREVLVVTVGRLVVAPLILIPLVMGSALLGQETSQIMRWVLYLIISMPVAMSAPLFVQLFGGDKYLSSRAVVFSTLIGLFTSLVFITAALRIEVWLGLAESVMIK